MADLPNDLSVCSDLEQVAHDAMVRMFAVLKRGGDEITLAETVYEFQAAVEAWQEAER